METPKKAEIKKYNYKIKQTSPMERKRKVIELIEERTDRRPESRSSCKKIARELCITPQDAENTVKELANEGLVQVGRFRKCQGRLTGRISTYERALSITPDADLSGYLSTSVDEQSSEKSEASDQNDEQNDEQSDEQASEQKDENQQKIVL